MAGVPGQALVVHGGGLGDDRLTRELARLGFAVAVVTDFADARERVTTEPPDLLVTDVRLGPFNGLHLVFAGKSVNPSLAAIVVGGRADLALSFEVERAGATFLLGPPSAGDLVAALRTVLPSANRASAPREERRRAPDRRQALAFAHDLHQRLEDRREAMERERRTAERRRADESHEGS